MDPEFLLLQRMRLGDARAVETFVTKYYPKILQYCRLRTGDQGLAEDLTQDTFERFFRAFGEYQHRGKAANFLYTIAANACRDLARKNRELPLDTLPDRPDPAQAQPDLRLDLEAGFRALPEDLRETALLFFFQGCRQREIAKLQGISLPLVKYRIRRARALLTDYFREEEPS